MRKDYHMHPTVLMAPEKFDAFVRQAIRKNIDEICVTDHMPLSISNASDRLEKGRVGEYCRQVRCLARKYEGIIKIKCGIEIDFHPDYFSEIRDVLGEGEFDYILASSHMHLFTQEFCRYTFNEFAAMAIENTHMAVETGLFTAVAHLDMYRFVFENPHRFPLKQEHYLPHDHETAIKSLLRAIAEKDMYLEINPHLAESKGSVEYVYPQEEIVSWAMQTNVRFAYGSDAHDSRSVGALLDQLEVHPVYGPALKKWEEEK